MLGAMNRASVVLAGFGAGSIPFSNIASRRTRGVDLREVGSGTVSGTALYRVAGFTPLAVAGVLARPSEGGVARALATIDNHYTRHTAVEAETSTETGVPSGRMS